MRFCEVQGRKGWTAGRPADWSQEARLIWGNERQRRAPVTSFCCCRSSRRQQLPPLAQWPAVWGKSSFLGRRGGFVFLTPCAGMGLEPFKATLQIQTAPIAVLTLERLWCTRSTQCFEVCVTLHQSVACCRSHWLPAPVSSRTCPWQQAGVKTEGAHWRRMTKELPKKWSWNILFPTCWGGGPSWEAPSQEHRAAS